MRLLKFVVCFAGFLVAACGDGSFLEAQKKPRLPGDRIDPLAKISALKPDSSLRDVQPVLPPSFNADWPQPHGGPNHSPGHRSLSSQPSLQWSVDIGEGTNNEERRILYPPVSDGERLYSLDAGGRVIALAANSGEEIWRRNPVPEQEEDGYGGGLSVADGKVYFAAGFSAVIAFDSSNGEELWRTALPTPSRAAPSIDRGRVFVITIDNRLIVLDGSDGRILWSFEAPAASATLLGGASPAAAAGAVIAAMSTGEIFAFSAASGRVVWDDALKAIRGVGLSRAIPAARALPVIDNDQVFAVGAGGFTTSINFVTGQRIWDIELGGAETPIVLGDYIYMVSSPEHLVALRRRDGAVVWATNLGEVLGDNDDDDPLHRIYTGPIAAGGHLVLVRGDGVLFFIQPSDGALKQRIELPGPTVLAPIVVNGTMYILTEDGVLAAYR
jgi:outer membrane protein assembly factor BamB